MRQSFKRFAKLFGKKVWLGGGGGGGDVFLYPAGLAVDGGRIRIQVLMTPERMDACMHAHTS